MARQFNITYTNFLGGLNNRKAAHLLEPNEGQIVKNVDLRDGMLRPMRDLGTTTKTFSGLSRNYKWIWYAAGSRWLGADQYRYALNDGSKTYFTVPGSAPRVHETAGSSYFQEHRMGVTPPPDLIWSVGNINPAGVFSPGTYTYAVTYETYDGLESNPPAFPLQISFDFNNWRVSFTVYASNDRRVVRANIYRSELNGGVLYYAGSVDAKNFGTANNFVDNYIPDTALDKLRPLTWGTGGSPVAGSAIVADHGVPPVLSILSNALHSVNDVSGVAGSGILFGAVGSTVRWSMLGYPEYWPEVNFFNANENVESILSWAGATYIFTSSNILIARGYSDDDISITKTLSAIGVYPGMGHLTKLTPRGAIYLSREGLALFDGSNSTIISSGKLSREFLDPTSSVRSANQFVTSAYYQDKYYLFCNSETIILDMRDGLENLRFSTSTHSIKAATTANFSEPAYAEKVAPLPGRLGDLYVVTPGIYTTFPTITFSDTSLQVTANVSIENVTVNSAGSGYTATPDVTVTGNCTRQAKLQAVLVNDKVSSITVVDPGEGYTVMPTVTIAAPPAGGTQATISQVSVKLSSARTYSTFQLTAQATVAAPGNAYYGHYLNPDRSSKVNGTYTYSMIAKNSTNIVDNITGHGYYNPSVEVTTIENYLNFVQGDGYQLITKPNITTAPTATVSGTTAGTGLGGTVTVGIESVGCRKLGLITLGSKIWKFGGEIYASPGLGRISTSFVHSYDPNISQWSSENVSIPITGNHNYTGSISSQPAVTVGSFAYTPTLQWTGDATANARKLFAFSTGNWGVTTVDVPNTFVALAADATHIYMASLNNPLVKITANGTSTTNGTTLINTIYYHGFSMVCANNKLYAIGGQYDFNGTSTYYSTINEIDKNTGAITTDSTGADFGFTGRSYHVSAVVDDRYIIIHGGESKDANGNLIYLSDLHVYDTQAAAGQRWVKKFDTIASIGERSKHAMTLFGSDLYIVGGSNSDTLFTDDVYRLPVDQLLDYNLTPNLYVAGALSGSTVDVKPFGGGNAMSTWQWRGREEMAPDNGPLLTWMRARVYGFGHMTWKVLVNGISPPTAPSTFSRAFQALASAVSRFWFPSNNTVRGQRLTLDISERSGVGYEPTNTDNITRIEIEAKQDGE